MQSDATTVLENPLLVDVLVWSFLVMYGVNVLKGVLGRKVSSYTADQLTDISGSRWVLTRIGYPVVNLAPLFILSVLVPVSVLLYASVVTNTAGGRNAPEFVVFGATLVVALSAGSELGSITGGLFSFANELREEIEDAAERPELVRRIHRFLRHACLSSLWVTGGFYLLVVVVLEQQSYTGARADELTLFAVVAGIAVGGVSVAEAIVTDDEPSADGESREESETTWPHWDTEISRRP